MGQKKKLPDRVLPSWFDGKTINEAQFCEEFLQTHRIAFANGAFFTPDGRVTDDLPLRAEIYEALKGWAISNIPKKISNILEVMKMEAQAPDLPPEPDRIHLANGTLLLDGTFREGRPEIVRNRLPVRYNPEAPSPELWMRFLGDLLYPEDIPTLQEFIGYCLIPSNKGQRMMVIKGSGGEGKSQIGSVLSCIFGTNMKDGSIGKISENRFARADLEHVLLCVDDDMRIMLLNSIQYFCCIQELKTRSILDFEQVWKYSPVPLRMLPEKDFEAEVKHILSAWLDNLPALYSELYTKLFPSVKYRFTGKYIYNFRTSKASPMLAYLVDVVHCYQSQQFEIIYDASIGDRMPDIEKWNGALRFISGIHLDAFLDGKLLYYESLMCLLYEGVCRELKIQPEDLDPGDDCRSRKISLFA